MESHAASGDVDSVCNSIGGARYNLTLQVGMSIAFVTRLGARDIISRYKWVVDRVCNSIGGARYNLTLQVGM